MGYYYLGEIFSPFEYVSVLSFHRIHLYCIHNIYTVYIIYISHRKGSVQVGLCVDLCSSEIEMLRAVISSRD